MTSSVELAATRPATRPGATMQAVAVVPGVANSIHLRDVPVPRIEDPREVLVQVLEVGVDGTDKEINAAEYGKAPDGDDYLIIGHESFGRVVSVGSAVTELSPGDYVVASVRRPGSSIYDTIGRQDLTTDSEYFERGINLRHGFLTEYYVERAEYLVRVPQGLRSVGVLLEPTSVAEKAIDQAFEIQRRLRVWQPRRVAVLGAGTLGLIASAILEQRGLQVTTFGLQQAPYLNSDLLSEIGVRYVSTRETSLRAASRELGPFDLIIEGTGYSPLVFEAMEVLATNGVLVMLSVTGGDRMVEVPADRINQGFVLGNKVAVGSVNASRGDFERAVQDLSQTELACPGWLSRLITRRVHGLAACRELIDALEQPNGAIKIVCEVADFGGGARQ